jgi:hypothetical protein
MTILEGAANYLEAPSEFNRVNPPYAKATLVDLRR